VTYIMDTSEEGRRVERKTDRALTLEQLRWAGVRDGSHVLDVGCAAGTTCRMMAGIVGDRGKVVGMDASGSRLTEGLGHGDHRPTIEYRQGDAGNIPATDAEFDVCWSRFLFEYLPRPEAALAEMIRVAKPNGIVCVSDIDGNCIWHHPSESGLCVEIDQAIRTLGDNFHPRIGLGLYTMFVDAKLRDVAVDIRPYHVIAGTIDAEREEHWRMKLDAVGAALRSRGWSEGRVAALTGDFMRHLRDPRTLTYSTLITVRGIVGPELHGACGSASDDS